MGTEHAGVQDYLEWFVAREIVIAWNDACEEMFVLAFGHVSPMTANGVCAPSAAPDEGYQEASSEPRTNPCLGCKTAGHQDSGAGPLSACVLQNSG